MRSAAASRMLAALAFATSPTPCIRFAPASAVTRPAVPSADAAEASKPGPVLPGAACWPPCWAFLLPASSLPFELEPPPDLPDCCPLPPPEPLAPLPELLPKPAACASGVVVPAPELDPPPKPAACANEPASLPESEPPPSMGIPPDSPPALDPAFSNAALMADMPPAAEVAPPITAAPATLAAPAAMLAAPIAAPMAAPAPKLPMPPAFPTPVPEMTPATSGGTRLTSMSNATQKTSITPSSSKFSVPVFILA